MKKKILSITLIAIIVMIVSITTTYATNYLYNSSEVYYDNTNSNITSSDVQGAIDELYTEATNYSSINTRVTALETLTGTNTLTTTNKTLTGAVNELNSNLTDTGWIKGTDQIYYRVKNGVCYIKTLELTSLTTSFTSKFTLPEQYRPSSMVLFLNPGKATGTYWGLRVYFNGDVSVVGFSSGVDTWYSMNSFVIN